MMKMTLANLKEVSNEVQDVLGRFASHNGHRCPKCTSIVYSRKSRFCGVCGMILPESILFTEAERTRMQNLLRTERQRHRAWMQRHEPSAAWQLSS